MSRDIVAEFIRNEDGSLEMHSMVVLQDEIGYQGKPCRSISFYDVEFSKAYGYIFHLSGGGGDHVVTVNGPYWTSGTPQVKEVPTTLVSVGDQPPWKSPETLAIRERNKTERLTELPAIFDMDAGEDLLSWLEWNAIQDDTVWCSVCKDIFPSESHCEHVWWCEASGDYSTPDERCECKSREECEGEE